MSSLVETLYPLPDLRRTPLSTLRWWEARRLRYNLVVGAAGLVTLTNFGLFGLTIAGDGYPAPLELIAMSMVYGAAANVCYTFGWMLEMVARAIWGRQAPLMGPLLYREGMIFSVGVTLLPNLFLMVAFIARMLQIILS